jgi:hypothetical protein
VSPAATRAAGLGVLGLLVAVGAGPLAAMLLDAAGGDRVFTGADGPFPADQFQYFAWIREHSEALLVANRLDTAPSDRVFVHPMFLLSGLGVRLGLSVELAYLLWKPVAIAALFAGCAAYAARFVPAGPDRVAAVAIGALFASPLGVVLGGEVLHATAETYPAARLWGYLPAAIAIGLMPLFLLGAERLARRPGRARDVALVSACGAAASWLHPWQGQVLLLTLALAVALRRGRGRGHGGLAIAATATLAPLLYYFVLSRVDPSWELAARANEAFGQVPLWAVAVALLPLAAAAPFGLRRRLENLGEALLVAWLPATIAAVAFLSPSYPAHALEGVSIPLAVLAVRGLARLRRPLLTGAFAVAMIIPGTLDLLDAMRDAVNAPAQPHHLTAGEDAALEHLARDPAPGDVLASTRLGALVPSATGRRSWVGHPSWTRDFAARAREADALLRGALPPERAAAVVRSSGARFVLVDCHGSAEALRALADGERAFGCARVLRMRGPTAISGRAEAPPRGARPAGGAAPRLARGGPPRRAG